MFYVYADHIRLTEGTTDFIQAVQDLIGVHFVHNYKYLKSSSKFLELIQLYFLKIKPDCGSKSNAYKVGKTKEWFNVQSTLYRNRIIDHM